MAEDFRDPNTWGNAWWRLNHLYTIVTDEGSEIAFTPNEEQAQLFQRLHTRNLVLKARQLGFTTFIDLLCLDQALWNRNFTAAIIAHSLDDAARIFRTKVLNPYRALPDSLKRTFPLERESASELVFAHGSSITVSTSVRSGTVNLLHVSEMGKIARKYPERAREIVTGSFEAVPKDGMIVVESTAEGADGWFHDACMDALNRHRSGGHETRLDFRLHFFPWYRKRSYVLDEPVHVGDEHAKYFRELSMKHGIQLTQPQKAWYIKKAATLKEDMGREYPSTPEESFAQSTEGTIFGKEMAALRMLGRIGAVPLRPGVPVNTFWDFGVSDMNSIWLHQRVGSEHRLVRFFQDCNEGLRYYWNLIEKWRMENDAKWGKHYLPHDADTRIQGYEIETRKQILEELGMRQIVVVPRVQDLRDGIELVRRLLNECTFDERGCEAGIECLEKYTREWDDVRGVWGSSPRHDKYSHGADAFRQLAQGFKVAAPVVASRAGEVVGYGRGGY